MGKILVTGGVRSGKSRHAEKLIGSGPATYVAPGPTVDDEDDADWRARIEQHRARRPSTWRTVESSDIGRAIAEADGPVIVDCLGIWVTALIDELSGWECPEDDWMPEFRDRVAVAAEAVELHASDVVLVTNEVGMGLVPSYRSGRVFRDLLGWTNQAVAASCDAVHMVIAGRVIEL